MQKLMKNRPLMDLRSLPTMAFGSGRSIHGPIRAVADNPTHRKWAFFIVGQIGAFALLVGSMLHLAMGEIREGLAYGGAWLLLRRVGEFDGLRGNTSRSLETVTVADVLFSDSSPKTIVHSLGLPHFLVPNVSRNAAVTDTPAVIQTHSSAGITPRTNLAKALRQMEAADLEYLPVVDGQRVIGVLSRQELMRQVQQACGSI